MDLSLLAWGAAGWGDEMAKGALVTILVALLAYALGIVLGSGIAACKLSGVAPLRWFASVYTTVVRGIPELLVIYLVFFGGGQALRAIASGLFGYEGYVDPPVFVTGVLCLGVSGAAYAAEVIRGAVQTVPRGQIEAAVAVGMSRPQRFWRVLMPQTARYALPGLGNVWQFVLKDTSLISVIGLVEIMRQGTIATGATKEPFTFYVTAAVLYLGLTAFSNQGFARAETWANKGVAKDA